MTKKRKKKAAPAKRRAPKGAKNIRFVVHLEDQLPQFGSGFRRLDVKDMGENVRILDPYTNVRKIISMKRWLELKPRIFVSLPSGVDGLVINGVEDMDRIEELRT